MRFSGVATLNRGAGGTLKMIRECELAQLPKPAYFYDMSGFFVEFRKDVYNEEYLSDLGLNERQLVSCQSKIVG